MARQDSYHQHRSADPELFSRFHASMSRSFAEFSGSQADRAVRGPRVVGFVLREMDVSEQTQTVITKKALALHALRPEWTPGRQPVVANIIFAQLGPYRNERGDLPSAQQRDLVEQAKAVHGRHRAVEIGVRLVQAVAHLDEVALYAEDAVAAWGVFLSTEIPPEATQPNQA